MKRAAMKKPIPANKAQQAMLCDLIERVGNQDRRIIKLEEELNDKSMQLIVANDELTDRDDKDTERNMVMMDIFVSLHRAWRQ